MCPNEEEGCSLRLCLVGIKQFSGLWIYTVKFLAEERLHYIILYKGESNEFCANAPFFVYEQIVSGRLPDASRKYKIAQTRCLSEKVVYIWN